MATRKPHPSPKKSSCRFLALPPTHCCTIVGSVREGVVTLDLQKTVTCANPAAETITGLATEAMICRRCYDILQSEICRHRCPVDALLAGEKPHIPARRFPVDRRRQRGSAAVDPPTSVPGGPLQSLSKIPDERNAPMKGKAYEDAGDSEPGKAVRH